MSHDTQQQQQTFAHIIIYYKVQENLIKMQLFPEPPKSQLRFDLENEFVRLQNSQ